MQNSPQRQGQQRSPQKLQLKPMQPPAARHQLADLGASGKLVTFYRNGDPHFRGLGVSINDRTFVSMATLTAWLNEKISTPSGVRHVFRLPDGKQVTQLADFEAGGHYVVSSSPKLVRSVEYGGPRPAWRMKPPSAKAGKRTRDDLRLLFGRESAGIAGESDEQRRHLQRHGAAGPRSGGDATSQGAPSKPRSVVFISNTHRQSRERLLINPGKAAAADGLDTMLEDLGSLLVMANPPATCLYTAYPPYRKVIKLSQLFSEYKDYDSFIACGQEFLPAELRSRPLEAAAVWGDEPVRGGGVGDGSEGGAQRLGRLEPVAPTSGQVNGSTQMQQAQAQQQTHQPPQSPSPLPPPPPPPQWPRNGEENRLDEQQRLRLLQLQQEQLQVQQQQQLGDRSPAVAGRYEAAEDSDAVNSEDEETGSFQQLPQLSGRESMQKPPAATVRIRGTLHTFPAPTATVPSRQQLQPPDVSLQLDWVYGCNSSAGLLALPTGDLLYASGNVLILLDSKRHRQRHYTEHTARVTCAAAHPVNAYIASGQAASRSGAPVQIRIWDAESLETRVVLSEPHLQTGITSISFSGESLGAYLLAVDSPKPPGHRQTLTVFDWAARREVLKSQTARDQISRAVFHPEDDSIIVTVGAERPSFWRIFHDSAGRSRALRDKKSGVFAPGSAAPSQKDEVTAVAFDLVGNVITGDSAGRLQLWCRDQDDAFVLRPVERLNHAHSEAIQCMYILGDGALISVSAKRIHVWDTLNGYSHVKEALTSGQVSEDIAALALKHPRSLDGRLVVATTGNCILEGSLHDQFFCLVQGHKSSSNANGLIVSAHPSEPDLATCGGADDDMSVCRWSASQCRLVWRVAVEDACSSAAYHPRGHLLLLGTATGRIVALQHARGEYAISCQVTERGQAVVCVRFSSNGRLLALGTSDGRIYMMSVEDNGLVYRKYRQGTLTGHSSPVVRLDFSVDSATLRSQSEDLEVRFWSVPNMSEVPGAESVSNVRFSTETCSLSYYHAAAWQLHQASSDTGITASCLSGHGDLLCAGDSAGQVSIFRYPTHPLQSQCVTSDALVSSVRDLMFAFGDSRLLVTDREAASLMQWSLVPERRS
ncbi:hypothetical protein BOX15_Mlig005285g2 [Macrostomum lignano]|uniref:Doublecortin domain-containing protein n=2 Tax=Macrostomum lignano TaxID=282301 RepID=A0A267GG23_9PLAT|nr:hypothetical protein BOX15_Mlig005285g2 [Macrostomum lignano]